MEYQPRKEEIPFYAQHEAGWYFCDRKDGSRLAELEFIGFRRPYFLFTVKFFTEDDFVRESIFDPVSQDLNLLNSRYFLLNKKSDHVLGMESFLTSRIGDTNTVTLGDRRRRGTVQRKAMKRAILWLLRIKIFCLSI